jgi:radical SAM superfamily enzyme YgiQ (UPF0313 family)
MPVKYSLNANKNYSPEPLGLEYIKSFLEKKGYSVTIIDNYIENLSLDQMNSKLNNLCLDFLGISFSQYSFEEAKYILNNLRDKPTLVCAGGIFASLAKEELLRRMKKLDCIVLGDGEKTILDLVESIKTNKDWRSVIGISYRKNKKVKNNLPLQIIKNLDALPFPKRVFLKQMSRCVPLAISASRGCEWSQCIFCCTAAINQKFKCPMWRFRSVKNIVEEIESLTKEYKKYTFQFVDDCFLGYGKEGEHRAILFANSIIKRKLEISYSTDLRVDQVNEKIIKKMKRSGLNRVYLGVECSNKESIKRANKGFLKSEILNALKICYRNKISVDIGFIPFSHEANLEEIEENINFLKNFNKYNPGLFINILTPLYGTQLFYNMKKKKLLCGDEFKPILIWENKKVKEVYKYMVYYNQILFALIEKIKIKKWKEDLTLRDINIRYANFLIKEIKEKNLNAKKINGWIRNNLFHYLKKNEMFIP